MRTCLIIYMVIDRLPRPLCRDPLAFGLSFTNNNLSYLLIIHVDLDRNYAVAAMPVKRQRPFLGFTEMARLNYSLLTQQFIFRALVAKIRIK